MNLPKFIEETDRVIGDELSVMFERAHRDNGESGSEWAERTESLVHTRLLALLEEVVGEIERRKIDMLGSAAYSGGGIPKSWICDSNNHNKVLSSLVSHLQEEMGKIKV